MEQKNNEKDVLIVKDENTGETGVVTGLKNDGTPNVTNAKAGNNQDFLKFDRNGDMLDNFLSNFIRQCKEPNRFGFYKVAADSVENILDVIKDLLKNPEANKDLLAPHHIDTSKYEQQTQQEQTATAENQQQNNSPSKNGYHPIDESKIDWQNLEDNWGIKRQSLEESGDLKKMLNYRKSNLVTVSPKFGDDRFITEARLSFRTQADGSIQLIPHLIRKEPQLDRAFRGYTFSAEDKTNLKTTGNMGSIAQLTNKETGETTSVYISIDRQTNHLVSVPIEKVRIPEKIGNTVITKQEQQELRAGRAIPDKEITLSNGKTFTTTLQVNADQRSVEFVPRNAQIKQGTSNQQKTSFFQWLDKDGNIRAPKTFGGVTLSPEQQSDYCQGKAILVTDMVKDKQGEPFTAYIKFNKEAGRPKYYRTNPDISQAKQVTPAAKSKTQVAVNSDGKTNEATKNIKQPLKKEQVSPTNAQQSSKMTTKAKGVSF